MPRTRKATPQTAPPPPVKRGKAKLFNEPQDKLAVIFRNSGRYLATIPGSILPFNCDVVEFGSMKERDDFVVARPVDYGAIRPLRNERLSFVEVFVLEGTPFVTRRVIPIEDIITISLEQALSPVSTRVPF